MKTNFYKNDNERMLKLAIDKLYNDYVGGEENHYLDYDERYFNFTEDSLIETITKELLTAKDYVELENSINVLEAKHIRFMGAKRVREIVEHRVKFRHVKEGWCFEDCKKVYGEDYYVAVYYENGSNDTIYGNYDKSCAIYDEYVKKLGSLDENGKKIVKVLRYSENGCEESKSLKGFEDC